MQNVSLKFKIFTIFFILLANRGFSQSLVISKVDSLREDTCYYRWEQTTFYNEEKIPVDKITNVKCWYSNGNLKEEYSRNLDGNIIGPYRSFYENGQLKELFNAVFGRRIGMYVAYYSTGNKKITGQYANIKNLSEIRNKCDTTFIERNSFKYPMVTCGIESFKSGEWLYYNEAGEIIKREHY